MLNMQTKKSNWRTIFADGADFSRWERYARAQEKRVGSFVTFDPRRSEQDSNPSGPLWGVPCAVKDNIAVRRFPLTCGSRILQPGICPYTATAVRKVQEAGAVVIGKTNLDEFGMGSSTENSAVQQTRNPWDLDRVPGGSSGGSAAAVAAGIVPFAFGSDTGGSVRQPASFCGIYGLKPTYGSVSRYGLVAYASSLEVIGVMAKSVAQVEEVFGVIQGEDPLDQSSVSPIWIPDVPEDLVIGTPVGLSNMEIHPDVLRSLQRTKSILVDLGYSVVDVQLPTLDYVVAAYYVIATAEASSNLARYDGVRYGKRSSEPEDTGSSGTGLTESSIRGFEDPEELVLRSRTQGLGSETKLRILLGTYVLRSGFYDQYYLRAQKVRTAIREDFARVFRDVHLVLMPVYPIPPFERGSKLVDPFTQKMADIFTSAANLAALPALAFPASVENGLPIGMQFLAPPFGEQSLFRACRAWERVFPCPEPPGFRDWWSV